MSPTLTSEVIETTEITEITDSSARPATLRRLRPLIGSVVTLHTAWGTSHGTLLSCVKDSAWLVADDDTDLVVPLAAVLAVRPAPTPGSGSGASEWPSR